VNTETHLLGGQVGHASGHLVGPGDQLRDPHLAQGHLPRPGAVLLALGTPGAQVVPQVPAGRVLHHHVQRACRGGGGGEAATATVVMVVTFVLKLF